MVVFFVNNFQSVSCKGSWVNEPIMDNGLFIRNGVTLYLQLVKWLVRSARNGVTLYLQLVKWLVRSARNGVTLYLQLVKWLVRSARNGVTLYLQLVTWVVRSALVNKTLAKHVSVTAEMCSRKLVY